MQPSALTDQPGTVARWMGVGRSDATDAYAAGAAATRGALRHHDPGLLLACFSIVHDPERLARGVADAAPGVPVIGCSTHGEIGPDGPRDGTVVVCAVGGAGFSVATRASTNTSRRQRAAGAEVAQCVREVGDHPYKVLFMLTDGLTRGQEEIVRGAYGVVGARVPLFGGAAADAWRMKRTYQLHGSDVFSDAVVAACIAGDAPMGIGIRHGWHPTGEPMIVTSSGNGRVYQLDDEPALDAYLRRIGAPEEIYDDEDALQRYVLSRPLGVQRRSGVEVRNMSTEVDVEGRSIGGGGELTQGGLAWAMAGDEAAVLDASEEACAAAIESLQGRPPIGLVTLSCAACRSVLGEEGIVREVDRMAGRADGVPFAGFYTYGEIARTRGIDGFHNQTTVVLALS